jgi:hypothetical protein
MDVSAWRAALAASVLTEQNRRKSVISDGLRSLWYSIHTKEYGRRARQA